MITLDPESAVQLAKHQDWLSLNSLSTLTPELAKAFSQFDGDTLDLNGAKTLDVETAKLIGLARCKSQLSLNGLSSISPEVVNELADGRSGLSLQGLQHIDQPTRNAIERAAVKLKSEKRVLIVTKVDGIEEPQDKDRIQGTWQIIDMQEGGYAVPAELVQMLSCVFHDYTLEMHAGKQVQKNTFTLDPSTTPKSIDMVDDERMKRGIYELQGDTLRLCFEKNHPGQRPTAFVSQSGSVNDLVLMMKRRSDDKIVSAEDSYSGERLRIQTAKLNGEGKVEIKFNTLAETVYHCPGANARKTEHGIELIFIRAMLNQRPDIEYPVSPANRPHAAEKVIVVDAGDQSLYVQAGFKRILIWSQDNAQIIGQWQVTYSEDSGRKAPPEMLKNLRFEFTAEKMLTQIADRKSESTYKLNPSTSPALIDFTENGHTKMGIYDLDGDALRICIAETGSERPTSFDSLPNSANDVVIMLKRLHSEPVDPQPPEGDALPSTE